jgi:pimeloyl-ACP methyl ester carboxylesterase
MRITEGIPAPLGAARVPPPGHGESEKPNFGLKIHRLAEDLREALVAANADDVTLLGHSMGCSVIWAYWKLFGAGRLGKTILTDEPRMLTSNAAWTPEEREIGRHLPLRYLTPI